MLKYIWKNKVLLIFVLLAFWLVPNAIGLSEQSKTESIITAIGVDKINNEFEVSLQYIVPSSNNTSEELKLTTQKGNTVGEAIENIKLQQGKLSGFAHCRFLAFNDEACKENFIEVLDYLLRRKTNTNNILLINTPESAKELLSISNKLDSDLYSFLNNSGSNNDLGDFHNIKTIGDYYEAYFSKVKCLAINSVNVKSEKTQEDESQSSDMSKSAQSSTEAGSSQKNKKFENKAIQIILKNDKKLITLSEQESDNLAWFNPKIKKDNFSIKNFNEDNLKNAKILFNVNNKIVTSKASFKDNQPHLNVKVKIYVRTGEVDSENLQKKDYQVLQKKYSKELTNKMKEEIVNNMKSAEKHFKENNYDVINCYNNFYKFKNKELKEYLKTNKKEDFIKNVIFDYKVEIIQNV